ncbi:MAG: dTDP-4-dehydrorhamnose reductase [Candidatus Sulfobium sp.]|jgi:dTDP-4-dehydrorhamnose reductase
MKVVLTGASGMLGHDLQRAFRDVEVAGFSSASLDITRLDAVIARIREARPDLVIHAAAFANVDQCESEPEKAYLVNGIGTRNVVMACEEAGCPIVYVSSDYVFDGKKRKPYNEWDDVNPIGVYGLSKLMGERFVSTLTNRFYIVRTSWLYGREGKNFVDTIIRLLSEKDRIEVVNDQVGCPTYTLDLAGKIRELIGKGYGIYHVTNTGVCSWFDFAVAIAAGKGIRKDIVPVTSRQFKRPAERPAYSVLGNTMLRLVGIDEPRTWGEALSEYLCS